MEAWRDGGKEAAGGQDDAEEAESRLDWIDARMNPFLVKDLRSWLRSERFLVVFFLAMALAQVVMLFQVVTEENTWAAGINLFNILVPGLMIVLGGIIPWLSLLELSGELTSRSLELALLTRTTPVQLVRGRILSSIAASLVYFSAVGPCLTVAYLLGGVDLAKMLGSLVLVFVLSILSSLLAIFLGAVAGQRRWRLLGMVPPLVGLLETSFMVSLLQPSGPWFARDPFATTVLVLEGAVPVLMGAWFLYAITTSRLSFQTDDRDSRPRLALSALTASIVIAGEGALSNRLASSGGAGSPMLPVIPLLAGMMVFGIGVLLVMETPDVLSNRVKARWPRSSIARLCYAPGPGRLYAYILMHLGMLTLAGAIPIFTRLPWDDPAQMFTGFTYFTYFPATLLAFLGAGTFLHWLLSESRVVMRFKLPRGLTVLLAAAGWLLIGATWRPIMYTVTGEFPQLGLLGSPQGVLSATLERLGSFRPGYTFSGGSSLDAGDALIPLWLVLVPTLSLWGWEIFRALRENAAISRAQREVALHTGAGGGDRENREREAGPDAGAGAGGRKARGNDDG